MVFFTMVVVFVVASLDAGMVKVNGEEELKAVEEDTCEDSADNGTEDDNNGNGVALCVVGENVKCPWERVVLVPLTRYRALNYSPQDAHQEFYGQRATKGGLLITEAVAVSQEGIGFSHSPDIWTEEQLRAWHRVVHAVHDKGGYIFLPVVACWPSITHVGRCAYYQPKEDSKGLLYGPVSSTAKRVPDPWQIRLPDGIMAEYSQPQPLRTHEIPKVVEQFRHAARNTREAEFDGMRYMEHMATS
ncbi:hypothetical protein L7F22_022930 [Adiantum nelumboides]|nr:hypothetical protein [Adiantum nelumboides]